MINYIHKNKAKKKKISNSEDEKKYKTKFLNDHQKQQIGWLFDVRWLYAAALD